MANPSNRRESRRRSVRRLALTAAVLFLMASFAQTVYAAGASVNAKTQAAEETSSGSRVITGFADFDIQAHYLSVDGETRPSADVLTAMMPETLAVYVNEGTEPESVPVTWYCTEGDYEQSEAYYVQFSPDFGSDYSIAPDLSVPVDAPYIGVFITDEETRNAEDRQTEDGEADDTLNGAPLTYTNSPYEAKLFTYLTKNLRFNTAAAIGIMADIFCECSFYPNNLQNKGNQALGMTDEQYTAAVDNGTYTNFVYDKYGYGLFQWTFWSRKQNLINFVRQSQKSIGDYTAQLDFMYKEYNAGYKELRKVLENVPQTAQGAYDAAYAWCQYFDQPADTYGQAVKRGNLARDTLWGIYESQGVVYSTKYERISGDSRYATALTAADYLLKLREAETFDAVIVANAANYPDALSGAALAGKAGAPILLVSADGTNDGSKKTLAYIKEHLSAEGKVYILGGEAAVGKKTETALKDLGYDVIRLGGETRYETNLRIVEELAVESGADIFIATGRNFADALSVSGASARSQSPVILAGKTLPEETLALIAEIQPETIYIIGGPAAVPAEVEEQLKEYPSVVRIEGDSRYATSVEAAKVLADPETKEAVIATGKNFPDGLVASLVAAEINAPILLVSDTGYEAAAKYAETMGIDSYYVMGGTAAVSDRAVRGLMRE